MSPSSSGNNKSASEPAPFSLRPYCKEDDAFLFQLCSADRAGEFDFGPGSEALQAQLLRFQYDAQTRGYTAAFPDAEHWIVCAGERGRPIGRLLVDRAPDSMRLVDIVLLPDWRGRGVGSALIRNLQRQAAESGVPFRLLVLRTNPAADLYRRLGFQETGGDDLRLAMEWTPPTARKT